MKELKDRDGKVINEGDVIAYPSMSKDRNTIEGYYVSKVKYDEKRGKLVTEDGYGFSLAYNVVKLNL